MKLAMSAILLLAIIVSSGYASEGKMEEAPKSLSVTQYEQKLFESLMTGYNPEIRPTNSTTVEFGMALISAKFNEADSRFEGTTFIKYVWNDPRLSWNETEYGGVSVLHISPSNVWRPDITLYSTAEPGLGDRGMACGETNVLIYASGEVLWVPPCKVVSLCGVTNEPHATQLCILKFGSWTYDANLLNLQLYKSETKVDLSDFADVTDWRVVSGQAERIEKYYPCCPEPYVSINFNVTMKLK